MDHAAQHHPARARAEIGIGLVEVVVALLIIGVIGAFAVQSLVGTKQHSSTSEGRTVARSLGEGIEQFKRDHGGRLPTAPGTADWGNGWHSPVDAANGNKPYLRGSSVESLTDGSAALQTAGGTVAPGGANAPVHIQYRTDTSAGFYALVVRARTSSGYEAQCRVSNAAGAGSATFLATLGTGQRC